MKSVQVVFAFRKKQCKKIVANIFNKAYEAEIKAQGTKL